MARLTGYLNTSLTVSDADASARWYCETLGLEVVSNRLRRQDFSEALTGIQGAHLRIVHLRGPGVRLELMEYKAAAGGRVETATNKVGCLQVGFLTDDARGLFEDLKGRGVRMRSPAPVEIPEGPHRGGRIFFCEDPDGIVLKFIQHPPGDAPPPGANP